MSELQYKQTVGRVETFSVTRRDIERERAFQQGKQDRKDGKPCASANGAYLNGWYSPDTDYYYIPAAAAHLLKD